MIPREGERKRSCWRELKGLLDVVVREKGTRGKRGEREKRKERGEKERGREKFFIEFERLSMYTFSGKRN